MCVCMLLYMYTYTFIYIYIYIYIHISICMVYTCMCIQTCTYPHTNTYICTYTYMCIRVHIYKHTHTYNLTPIYMSSCANIEFTPRVPLRSPLICIDTCTLIYMHTHKYLCACMRICIYMYPPTNIPYKYTILT